MLSLLNWKETKACKTHADEPKKIGSSRFHTDFSSLSNVDGFSYGYAPFIFFDLLTV